MRADPLTLTAVFSKDVRYVVPMFQRPYVWNMKEHWEPLWEDIRGVSERVHASTQMSPQLQASINVPPHFLGAIVLDQIPTTTGSIDTRSVIDGQQRLTTLQVLIGAAQNVAQNHNLKQQSRLLGKLLWNDQDLINEPDHVFKVWPTNSDRDCFRSIMCNESLSTLNADVSMKLATAMQYFHSVINSWVSAISDEEKNSQFTSLVTSLRNHLKIVAIDLDSDDNAQVIFETLNARGTPLQAADLIKNLVFQRAESEKESVETLYSTYWSQFDRSHWRQEIRQGRLMRPVLDVFFSHWLAMTKERETLIHDLFPAFRENLNSSKKAVTEVLEDLSQSASVYRTLDQYPLQSTEGLYFHRQSLLDTTTTIPLLLYLFRLDEKTLPNSRRRTALRLLESYLVRRMLCRLTARNYNHLFLDLLTKVKKQPSEADSVILSYLRALAGESQAWPTDIEIQESLESLPIYIAFPRKRVRLVLEALELSMKTDLSEHVHPADTLTIEHLLPQHWTEKHWPLPNDSDKEVETINRDRYKHTLGNLTLVTRKLNPALSNAAWKKKRTALSEHSVLKLNWQIIKQNPDDWNQRTISNRTTELTKRLMEIWPGPHATVWGSEGITEETTVEQDGTLSSEPIDQPDEKPPKTDVELVRMIIDRFSGKGTGRLLSEAFVSELQTWPEVTVRPGTSTKSPDGLNSYIMAHRRGSGVGAFVYVHPKEDKTILGFRLPREYADNRPQVFARDVSPDDVYQVNMQIDSLDDIPEALELSNAAFENTF